MAVLSSNLFFDAANKSSPSGTAKLQCRTRVLGIANKYAITQCGNFHTLAIECTPCALPPTSSFLPKEPFGGVCNTSIIHNSRLVPHRCWRPVNATRSRVLIPLRYSPDDPNEPGSTRSTPHPRHRQAR
jgi:hypothetical protein